MDQCKSLTKSPCLTTQSNDELKKCRLIFSSKSLGRLMGWKVDMEFNMISTHM